VAFFLPVLRDCTFSEAWPHCAADIVGFVDLPGGHYPAEQPLEETWRELDGFFGVAMKNVSA